MARIGSQTPSQSVVLPYKNSFGKRAIDTYNQTDRTAQEWQERLLNAIEAVNDDGLWLHTKFGYSVPRRNGKNEVVAMRELDGMLQGERILHTAHRTTTSHSASIRLVQLLDALGYEEVQRVNKKEAYSKHYTYSKQFGLERIKLLDSGGQCDFRTRSGKGGLGEGFDLLIIDEAQEYTDDQESALKYVVSDSQNPQIIFCGTPPTMVSSGTVFTKYREDTLARLTEDAGWAEWSVNEMSDVHDVELWYRCNPSLGTILTERKIKAEITNDDVDFNIQRLGLWIHYNQKSAISEKEWSDLEVPVMPELVGKLFIGIKYGVDGKNAAMSLAVRTESGKIFVEAVDCRPIRIGNDWIIDFIKKLNNLSDIVIDGASKQQLLVKELKDAGVKTRPTLPTVRDIILANSQFENELYQETICHKVQPSLANVISNCDKRTIGSNGGFGYKALRPDIEIALMDSVILAHWACKNHKEVKKQQINY